MKFFVNFKSTPLFCAVKNRYIDIIQLLLKDPNIDVNVKSVINAFLNKINDIFYKYNLKPNIWFCLFIYDKHQLIY